MALTLRPSVYIHPPHSPHPVMVSTLFILYLFANYGHIPLALKVVVAHGLQLRISKAEAVLMDPQGRVLLEESGMALAHCTTQSGEPMEPATGVYVGVMHMEYIQYMAGTFPFKTTFGNM
jgi:hypothetical protein